MEKNILLEILEIVNSNKSDEEIRTLLEDYHENDIASVLEEVDSEVRTKIYQILDLETVSEIFSYFEDVEELLEEVDVEQAADIIELMDSDDAVEVLEELDEELRNQIIDEMDEEAVKDIEIINQYEEEQIGSKITNNYIVINRNLTIRQAMKSLVQEAAENDNVSTIFVVNDDNTYYGSIDLRDLIIARDTQSLEDVIRTSYPTLLATSLISDCINDLKEYSLDIVPVLDENNILLGVITSSDIVEIVDEEVSDDYAKLAGLSEEVDVDDNVIISVKKRIPWLCILLVLNVATALLISTFEGVVKTLPMLVFFQSMILGMGGNSGTQSLGVTIRLLSDEELDKVVILKAILKEGLTGLINGIILGGISFGLFLLFFYVTKTEIHIGDGYIFSESLKASFAISLSLLLSITLSAIMGCLIPMLFKLLKIDPAVASGPFITTINDVVSIVIYYGLAYLLFLAFL